MAVAPRHRHRERLETPAAISITETSSSEAPEIIDGVYRNALATEEEYSGMTRAVAVLLILVLHRPPHLDE
jgi:hypothetical protein